MNKPIGKATNKMRFCIIIGAMKAGTTSLFNHLAQHPQIAPSSIKEPSFFSRHYEKGLTWYRSLWSDQNIENKILLEASTNYTKYPSFADTTKNIFDFAQKNDVSLKFIYILRNPIERIESQHTYSFARWTSKKLHEQLTQKNHLIHVSRYARQLDRYTEKFGRKNILILDFDDLKNAPEKVLTSVCSFLNIDNSFQFKGLNEIHNKSKGTPITRPVDKIYFKHPSIKKIANLFPKKLRTSIAKLSFRKTITQNFKLTEDQKNLVRQYLKDDMAELNNKYGIDVSKWGF